MMKKRILSFILAVMIFFTLDTSFLANTKVEDLEDPEYWSAQGYIADEFYSDTNDYKYQNVASTPGRGEYVLRKGIDVSSWNGDIDWAMAKNAGVEFAIIRVGYRGYGTGKLVADANYMQNIEGALANGIQVGVYIYSQAINVEEAIEEAQFLLSRIYMYDIDLPVVIDFEYYSGKNGNSGRLYDANLSVEEATQICSTFCDTVENAGYTGMVYANKYMLSNKIDGDKLAENYRIWLAHYTTETDYDGIYDFWQYTSTGDGYAHGMESQNVDLNWWYDEESVLVEGKFATYDGCDFYRDANGDITCIRQNGTSVINEFKCDGTYTYYFQQDGTAMKNRLTYHPDGVHVIYFDEYGHEVFSDFANVKKTISGEEVDDYCFFDTFGYLYVDVVTYDKSGTKLYYANPYGVLERGKWFKFSDTVMCADGTPWSGAAGNFGYANADGTLMKDTYTYNWEGRLVYMQGNGAMMYLD